MSNQHPITPPTELVDKWYDEWLNADDRTHLDTRVAILAARWGADQELEACCEWTNYWFIPPKALQLRAARRPKPPSEADLALTDLEHLLDVAKSSGVFNPPDNIRRCLERLKKLEEATND